MTAHTPGPWKAADTACWFRGQQHPDHGKITVTAGENGVVANCYGRANARLIAAAPELLEALQFFVAPFAGLEVVPDGFIAKARVAIAKAKGDSDGR